MPDEDQKIVIPVPRRDVQPTDEVLTREAAEAVNVLTHVWDGEVEVTVIMSRRNSGNAFWATSCDGNERLRSFLTAVKKASYLARSLVRGNRPQ